MEITDFGLLDYLHDATLLEIVYDATKNDRRTVTLLVVCNPEAGYDEWNGKGLRITLEDVSILNHVVNGNIFGKEQIDSWKLHVPESMEKEVQEGEALGLDYSGHRFLISFHTGSYLQGICRRIVIERKDQIPAVSGATHDHPKSNVM